MKKIAKYIKQVRNHIAAENEMSTGTPEELESIKTLKELKKFLEAQYDDQWDEIHYSDISFIQNDVIRMARRTGYADFYHVSSAQGYLTFCGALNYLRTTVAATMAEHKS
jgi:hypothetical protein